jgi:hypothetical protein
MNEMNHFHQCDGILASPLELFLFSWHPWQINHADLYKLNTMVLIRFMKKLGVGDFEAHIVDDWIDKYEDRYISYVKKLVPESTPNEKQQDEDIESQTLLKK